MKLSDLKICSLVLFVCGSFLASCSESIDVGSINQGLYESNENTLAFVSDKYGNTSIDSLNFVNKGTTDFYIELSEAAKEAASFTLTYDEKVLTDYNALHATMYKALPQNLVKVNSDLNVVKGDTKSSKAVLEYSTADELDSLGTYVIPIKASVKSGNISLSDTKSQFLLFVKDLSKLPNADKSTGIKIFSCSGQDTNPLNTLTLTLKKSGKPLIDAIIIFSGNINYNSETGRVYIYNNEYCQHYLDYREKYLKPLQDKGIKVLWGILGNHDISGIANLSDKTAKGFAQDMKKLCDAYNLDGIFFDDEYSNYPYSNIPNGFVAPSQAAAARLCYETKKAMPDKLVTVYVYGRTNSLPNVDGHKSGEFVDYALHDYGGGYDLSDNYPGMPKSAMGLYSQEYSQGRFASNSNLQYIRNNGYGAHMIFAMSPFRNTWSGQLDSMQRIARILFDDELVYDGKKYEKDW